MRTKDTNLMENIVAYIDSCFLSNNKIPSVRDIANAFCISKSTVSNYLIAMKEKGMIDREKGWCNIKTKNMGIMNTQIEYVPVVGSVACGTPMLAEENIEQYLTIPKLFLGNGKYFILKAKGESMINAGIENGDYVIVKQQEVAEQGQIVVALIDNEATLKRYYNDNQKIRLHPENDTMQDMYFDNIVIQGVAIRVIKELK